MSAARHNAGMAAKAKKELSELFEKHSEQQAKEAEPPRSKRVMSAFLGDLKIPQKVDRGGRPVYGVWVMPGCKTVTTADLYAIAKKQGYSLHFTNSAR